MLLKKFFAINYYLFTNLKICYTIEQEGAFMSKDDKIVSLGKKRTEHEHKKEEACQHEENTVAEEPVYCSFCGRPNNQVVKMVKGPGVNICSECTMIAVQYLILNDQMPSAEAQSILDAFWGKCK